VLGAGPSKAAADTAPVRRSGLHQARCVGLAKTHWQSLLTATALNLLRMLN